MKTNTDKNFNEHPGSAGISTNPVILPLNLHSSPSSVLNVSHDPKKFTTTGTKDGEVDRNRRTKKQHGRETRSSAKKVLDDVLKKAPKYFGKVKELLRLDADNIPKGGSENKFKELFGEIEGEKLLEASQCCLFTTTGAIPGTLFISTQKVVFYGDKPISWPPSLPEGVPIQKPYKVVIPTDKIEKAIESENQKNPAEKYMHIVTNDDFEFWFTEVKHYERAFLNLRKALASVAK